MFKNSLETTQPEKMGIILGFWDQEKTSTIIQELENSVLLIEEKCKNLLEELMYYQFYKDELSCTNLTKSLVKPGSHKNGRWESASVPDIAFRKAIIRSRDFEEVFCAAFLKKLSSVNEALLNAGNKIGLKKDLFLFSTAEYLKKLKENVSEKVEKYWSTVKEEFVKSYVKKTIKSDVALVAGVNSNVSKITKSDLEFYKKLSKTKLKKNRKMKKMNKSKTISSPVFNKIKMAKFKRIRRRKVFEESKRLFTRSKTENDDAYCKKKSKSTLTTSSSDSFKDQFSKLKLDRGKSFKKIRPRKIQTSLRDVKSIDSAKISKDDTLKSEREFDASSTWKTPADVDLLCQDIMTYLNEHNPLRQKKEINSTENKFDLNFLARKIPFTTCASTTKSHNVGVNIQQYISLKNRHLKVKNQSRKQSSIANGTDKPATTPQVAILKPEQQSKPLHLAPVKNFTNSQYFVTTYPWSPKQNSALNDNEVLNNALNNTLINHKPIPVTFYSSNDDVFKINNSFSKSNNYNYEYEYEEIKRREMNGDEREDSSSPKGYTRGVRRKLRSRYTKTTPERFVQHQKSTTKHYRTGQKSVVKTEIKTECTVGSNVFVSNHRGDATFEMKKQSQCNNAYGDNCHSSDRKTLKKGCSKNFVLLSDLSRKFCALKEAANSGEKPLNLVLLKSYENEINLALEKYKEFLCFYEKFLLLKRQLKTVKAACEGTRLTCCHSSSLVYSAFYQSKTDFKTRNGFGGFEKSYEKVCGVCSVK